MHRLKESIGYKIVSIFLTAAFFLSDLSLAYPVQQSLQSHTLAVPSIFQTRVLDNEAIFIDSILSIGKYLLGDPEKGIKPLPLKYLSYVIKTELGGAIHEIDLDHISFYNGIVSIPVAKNDRRFIVQVALKNMSSLQDMKGNELNLSNTYTIRIVPVKTETSFGPDKSEDTEHLGTTKASTKNATDTTQELQNTLELLDKQGIDNMLRSVSEDDRLRLFRMIDALINKVGFVNTSAQLRYSFVKLLTCGDRKMVDISAVLSELSKQKLIVLLSNPQDIDFASVSTAVLLSVVDKPGFARINKTDKLIGAPKVLLVGPYKAGDIKIGQFLAPPLGAHRIASFLKVFGIEVDVYDTDLSGVNGLEKLVKEKKYDFIGFSMLHPTLGSDIKLMYHLKKLSPESIFIAGGQGGSFNYDILLNKTPTDIVVRGFGEFPMLNFVMSFDKTKDIISNYRNIKGIYLRDKEGEIIETDFAKQYTADDMHVISLVWDVAAIPYETYWQYMRGQYTDEHLKVMRNEGMLNTVRIYTESHCPMGCAFCSSTRFCDDAVGGKQKVILLSAEDIIKMIKETVKAHPDVTSIYFNDDNFMIKPERVAKLCDLIEKELSEYKLNFFALSRVDMVDYNILKRMQQVGFKMIIYGAESFSNKILEDMHKNVKGGDQAAVALKAVNDTVRAGLIARLNLILFYPTTRLEDIKITIDNSVKLMESGAIMDPFTYVEAYSGAKITTQGFETLNRRYFIEDIGQEIEVPDIILPQDAVVRKVAKEAMELKPMIDKEIKSKYGYEGKLPAPINSLSLFKAIYVAARFDTNKIDGLITKLMLKSKQVSNPSVAEFIIPEKDGERLLILNENERIALEKSLMSVPLDRRNIARLTYYEHIRRLRQRSEPISFADEKWLNRLKAAYKWLLKCKGTQYTHVILNRFGAGNQKAVRVEEAADDLARQITVSGQKFIICSSGSGVGYTTIMAQMTSTAEGRKKFKKFLMYTTRPRRPSEDEWLRKPITKKELPGLYDFLKCLLDDKANVDISTVTINNIEDYRGKWLQQFHEGSNERKILEGILNFESIGNKGKRISIAPHKRGPDAKININLSERIGYDAEHKNVIIYGEFDGVDYYFVKPHELDELIKDKDLEIQKYEIYGGLVQGICLKDVEGALNSNSEQIMILNTTPENATELKTALKRPDLKTFFIAPFDINDYRYDLEAMSRQIKPSKDELPMYANASRYEKIRQEFQDKNFVDYPSPESMKKSKIDIGYEQFEHNPPTPAKTDIYAVSFGLPSGELSSKLENLANEVEAVLPKGAIYHKIDPKSYHITVSAIQNFPFDKNEKNRLTPKELETVEKTVAKIAAKQMPYKLKFLGLRFGKDGSVIAVFEDNRSQTQELRKELNAECNKVCGKVSTAREKSIISITLMRIFSKIEGENLARLKAKAEELNDLSYLGLEMNLKTISFFHEIRWMHSEIDYQRKYSLGGIDKLIQNNLPEEYKKSFDIPNLPLNIHKEGSQLKDHLQAMLNVLDNSEAYKYIPLQYREMLSNPKYREFFEQFILLHDIGKTRITPKTINEEGEELQLYPSHEAESVAMLDSNQRLAKDLPDRDVLREVIRLHGALYAISAGEVTPEIFDKFVKNIKPTTKADEVLRLLIACDFLDVIGTHRPDPWQIRVWNFAQAYAFNQIWDRTEKAGEIKAPSIIQKDIVTNGTATTVIIGSPLPENIIKKLKDIQDILKSKVPINKFYSKNPDSLHISIETITDTDEPALKEEQKKELAVFVQELANKTRPFTVQIKGVNLTPSGAIIVQCYVNTDELLNIRTRLNQKFKVKAPKNIVHITLGYITEPLESKEFYDLLDAINSLRTEDLGQFTANGISIVFDSGQIFSRETNQFKDFSFFSSHAGSNLSEIVESSVNNERAKFIETGNKVITDITTKTDLHSTADVGNLDKKMATAEIRQRVERAIAIIDGLEKEKVHPETKASIELLKKNINQFEADGAVGSLIVLARRAQRENQTLIIGLETDWIPGMNVHGSLQRNAINALMKEIDEIGEALKSMGLDNVEIVRGNSDDLANKLLDEAGKTGTSLHNVIIVASTNTINSTSFAPLRNVDENDRPFIAGIDPTELIKFYEQFGEATDHQLYIRLAQLLYMTLELAAGKEPPQLPIIVSYDSKMRIVIFLPKAEPQDYEVIRNTYAAEKTALSAA